MKGVFFVVGPTASGKSDLAAEVASRLPAEIVSADAFQMYRGMPLLTAQPDPLTLGKVPHHLINSVSVDQEMSVAKFLALAQTAIAEIHRRSKLAIVVGGSGLYVKALTDGLALLPPVDLELRRELNALPLAQLNQRLALLDPATAQSIDRKNKRRVVRALEISLQTKTPASAQRLQWNQNANAAAGVFLYRQRDELYERIDCRVEEMFRRGVVEEICALSGWSATAAKTLGLEEIRRLLRGEISRAECAAAIQQKTRRYAKRQLTWFRRQTKFESLNLSRLKDQPVAESILQNALRAFAPAE